MKSDEALGIATLAMEYSAWIGAVNVLDDNLDLALQTTGRDWGPKKTVRKISGFSMPKLEVL